jgi:lipoprotein NlpI
MRLKIAFHSEEKPVLPCRAFAASFVLLMSLVPAVCGADTVAELHDAARAALRKGDLKEALELATRAVAVAPAEPNVYVFRARVHDSARQYAESVKDYAKAIELAPKAAEAYQLRGMAHFKNAQVKESVADFDRYLELKPDEKPGHWMRGISLYYARQYDEGRKQFDAYQSKDTNDVENGVWHFLCAAKLDGVEKARKAMLKIGKDGRVPMMEVYDLYKGKLKPEDVLAAAEAGKVPDVQRQQQRFYAHLYLGLYYDVLGDAKKAEEHLQLAAEKYPIGHYMHDVARVHLQLLRKAKK